MTSPSHLTKFNHMAMNTSTTSGVSNNLSAMTDGSASTNNIKVEISPDRQSHPAPNLGLGFTTKKEIPSNFISTSSSEKASTLHQNNLSTRNRQVPAGVALLGLRFAPPEVREIIFKYVFQKFASLNWYPEGVFPSILEVLQTADPILYDEALSVYSRVCTFGVHWSKPPPRTINLPLNAVQKLNIEFE